MVKLLEVLIVISLLKGAYYDSQLGIIPAAIDLLVCLAVFVNFRHIHMPGLWTFAPGKRAKFVPRGDHE